MFAKTDSNLDILSNEFAARFIQSLKADIVAGKHSSQVNHQVLYPAIHLLENRELCSQLTVEQIIRGTMNMALYLENCKYQLLKPESLGKTFYEQYLERSKKWAGDYSQTFANSSMKEWERALPVIERASQGPLIMMSGCLDVTLPLYFEYAKTLDSHFEIPELFPAPVGRSPVKSAIINQEVNKPYAKKETPVLVKQTTQQASAAPTAHEKGMEESALDKILNEFTSKVKIAKRNMTLSDTAIISLDNLVHNLNVNLDMYKFNKKALPLDKTRDYFIKNTTEAINNAQKSLAKDLGWFDYLGNLLKSIANVFIKATNKVTGSNFNLFQPVVPPMGSEVAQVGKELNNQVISETISKP